VSTYFEDLEVGRVTELGSFTFTAENIKAFAAKYDPQPFHLDEEAAKSSIFGALCASGWQTASIYTGLNIRSRQNREAEARARGEEIARWGPSPGFRDLKWPKPVFVGDTLRAETTVVAIRESQSRQDAGIVTFEHHAFNQRNEEVASCRRAALMLKRPAS